MDENDVTDAVAAPQAETHDDSMAHSMSEAIEMESETRTDQCLSDCSGAQSEAEDAPATADDTHVEDGRAPFSDYVIERERMEAAQRAEARKEFLTAIMDGPDLLSWVAPTADVDSDEVLAEHLVQMRNAVRYALSLALEDRYQMRESLSAANTATRMIRASIALAKAMNATKSKTVRGVARRGGPQD